MTELVGLFEDEQPLTLVVNLADVTPKDLTISQRVRWWEAQSPRHKYIGRGSIWGNDFSHLPKSSASTKVDSRDEAIDSYETNITPELLLRLDELQGMILGCWCKPKRCHGDVLLKLLHFKERFGGESKNEV